MSEFVQEVQTDTVDLVVHVQTADVFAMVFHDYVDEVVDCRLWILSVSVYITLADSYGGKQDSPFSSRIRTSQLRIL